MSELKRLIDSEVSDFERELLSSADRDAPGPSAMKKTLLSLGVASAVTAGAGSTALAGAAGATGWKLLGMSVGKWVSIGVLSTLAVGGGVVATHRARMASTPSEQPIAAAPGAPKVSTMSNAAAEQTATPIPSETSTPTATELAATPPAPSAPVPVMNSVASLKIERDEQRRVSPIERAPTGSTEAAVVNESVPHDSASWSAYPPPPPPASSGTTILQEIAELDRARGALSGGQPEAALQALDDHSARFKNAALAPEAMLTRIEALVALGRHEQAQALAATLLAQPGGQTYAARIRSLLRRK